MEKNTNNFELKILLKVFSKFWILILVATLLFAVLGYGYSVLTGETIYVGKASFWVNVDDKNNTQILGAAQMATNYSELAATDKLRRSAVEYGSLDDEWNIGFDEAVKKLKTMISVSKTDENSQIFSVYVRSYDPNETFVAITAVQNVMADVVAGVNNSSGDTAAGESYITRLDDVQSMEDITVSASSHILKAVVGAGIGFILSFAFSFFYFFINKKIDGAESVVENASYALVGNIKSGSKKKAAGANASLALASVEEEESFNVLHSKVVDRGVRPFVLGVVSAFDDFSADFVTGNLAAVCARNNNKVAIVCDERLSFNNESIGGVSVFSYASNDDGYYYGELISEAVRLAKETADIILISSPTTEKIIDLAKIAQVVDVSVVSVRKGVKVKDMSETLADLENVNTCIKGICYVER